MTSSVPELSMAEALLTKMSIPPKWSTAFMTVSSQVVIVQNAQLHRQRIAARLLTLLRSRVNRAGQGRGSAVFAARTTLAPRAARLAIASPMPREPPVTKSVLPAKDDMF